MDRGSFAFAAAGKNLAQQRKLPNEKCHAPVGGARRKSRSGSG